MAKRNYESKIAIAARNFVDVKEQVTEEPITATTLDPTPKEQQQGKKVEPKEPKQTQTKKAIPEIVEEKKEVENKPALEDDLVAEKVNDIIKSLIDSGQIQVKKNGKSGRPKKYEDETVLSSFRLTKTNYDYAYKMGRTKYTSMTEYINHLIDEDINK